MQSEVNRLKPNDFALGLEINIYPLFVYLYGFQPIPSFSKHLQENERRKKKSRNENRVVLCILQMRRASSFFKFGQSCGWP